MIPQERVSESILEQIVDIPAARIVEKMPEVTQLGPQERFQECVVEEIMDVLVPKRWREMTTL